MKKTLTILLVLTMAIMGVWANSSLGSIRAVLDLSSTAVTDTFEAGIASGTLNLKNSFTFDTPTDNTYKLSDEQEIGGFNDGVTTFSFWIWYKKQTSTFSTVSLDVSAPRIASTGLDVLGAKAAISDIGVSGAQTTETARASNFFGASNYTDTLTFTTTQMKSAGYAKYTITLDQDDFPLNATKQEYASTITLKITPSN